MNLVDFDFYNRSQDFAGVLFGAAIALRQRSGEPMPDPPLLIKFRRGYAEAPAWFMIQAAEFDPEPLTVEKLRVRDIYAAERYVQALMDIMTSEKWFDRVNDEYYLTGAGREVMNTLLNRPAEFYMPAEKELPGSDVQRLCELLGRIIEASLKSATPPGVWCLEHSRRRANGRTPLLKIYNYLSDLNAFRDDAHMASWQEHGISGHTWEAFSFVYDGSAKNADGLFDTLHYRGHARQDYENALAELAERGWIVKNENGYAVTEAGKPIREKAEHLTNTYFYAPWSCLSEPEIYELDALFTSLHEHLQAIAA